MKLLQKIFSVKQDDVHKIITVLGIKFKMYSAKLDLSKTKEELYKTKNNLKALKEQLRPTLKYTKYAKYQINKDLIDIQIKKFKKRGIIGINKDEQRKQKLIVSLTTFPERIGDVHYAVYSLLNQTVKPDKLILWLANEQFPDGEEDVSQELLDLKKHGLTIEFTHDIRSFKKFVPTKMRYPNDIIITADDDIYYPEDWLKKLYNEYIENPNYIYAHRVHKVLLDEDGNIVTFKNFIQLIDDESSSFMNFLTTGGGVLFPPNSLHEDAIKEELFTKISPSSDESWLWAMAVLNKTPIKVVKNPINHISMINALRNSCFGDEITLTQENIVKNKKDIMIQQILSSYPEIIDILKSENLSQISPAYDKKD